METFKDEDEEKDSLRELAAGEFTLNEKQKRIMEYVAANINITDFMNCLSEEMWLREVLKLAEHPDPYIKLSALRMWGQFMNYLGKKKDKGEPVKDVIFE